jgi:hypothetical protein
MLVMAAADRRCWFGRVRVPGAKLVATLAYSLYLTHKEVAHLDELWLPKLMDARVGRPSRPGGQLPSGRSALLLLD